MPIATSLKDWLLLGGIEVVIIAVTAMLTATVGRLLARRSRLLAFACSGIAVPVGIFLFAIISAKTAPAAPPPNDAPAMFFVAMLSLSLLALPFSLATAGLFVFRTRQVS